MISPFIGAYWSQRQETRSECSLRIERLLEGISIEPMLETWFLKSKSRRQTKTLPITKNAVAIESILRTNDRDIGGKPILDLGFSLSIWNGDLNHPISLSIMCGAYSKFVKNSAVLQFSACAIENDQIKLQRLEFLLGIFVAVLEPETGVAGSLEELAQSPGKMASEIKGLFAYRGGKWSQNRY